MSFSCNGISDDFLALARQLFLHLNERLAQERKTPRKSQLQGKGECYYFTSCGSPIVPILISSFLVANKAEATSLSPQSSGISMNTKKDKVIFLKKAHSFKLLIFIVSEKRQKSIPHSHRGRISARSTF